LCTLTLLNKAFSQSITWHTHVLSFKISLLYNSTQSCFDNLACGIHTWAFARIFLICSTVKLFGVLEISISSKKSRAIVRNFCGVSEDTNWLARRFLAERSSFTKGLALPGTNESRLPRGARGVLVSVEDVIALIFSFSGSSASFSSKIVLCWRLRRLFKSSWVVRTVEFSFSISEVFSASWTLRFSARASLLLLK